MFNNKLNSIIDERKTLVSEYESIEIKPDNLLEESEIEIKNLLKPLIIKFSIILEIFLFVIECCFWDSKHSFHLRRRDDYIFP